MKKSLLYLFSMFCMLSFFTACSDDDGPEFIGTELDGVYKGALDVSLAGNPVAKDMPQKVYITKVGENIIKMELKNFSFGPLSLGDIRVDQCNVTKAGNEYAFLGTQKITIPTIGECTVDLTGAISGEKIDMTINVKTTVGDVVVLFKGAKLAADQSSEAKIAKFTIDSKLVTSQPVIEGTAITFMVIDSITKEQLAALVPTIEISKGATITPEGGKAQDFSKAVTYVVTSEDGITTTTYTVNVTKSTKYTFDEWTIGGMYPDVPNCAKWASCNDAVALIKNMGSLVGIVYKGDYPVTGEVHDKGFAAKMVSVDTKGGDLFGQKIPKVTAGSMFLGTFNAFAALQDPMATTAFGIKFDKKPIEVNGLFKYTPGAEFYGATGELNPKKKDECSIAAVLYEIDKDDDTLDGNTIYTSSKIVAKAMFTSADVTKDFTAFSLKLDYGSKKYDATKKYKFAVIFSASKDGAAYEAAVGSTLIVDDVEIVSE